MLIKINSNLKIIPNKKGIKLLIKENKHDKNFKEFLLSNLDIKILKIIFKLLNY